MTEGNKRTAANKGRTVAAVDKDLKAFKDDVNSRFDDLENSVNAGFTQIANLLSDKRAQELNDQVQQDVQYDDEPAEYVGDLEYEDEEYEPVEVDVRDFRQSGRSSRKKKVGERPGDRIIRNLHPKQARARIGNPRDPYRINLEPRGNPGDTDQIPASLVNDIGYKRNLGKLWEEISQDEFEALTDQYAGYGGGFQGGYQDVEMSYDEDRTIYDSRDDQYDVRRPQTWPGYRGGGVGPRISQAVGSDPQLTAAAQHAMGQEYTPEEVAEFQRIRAQQQGLAMPDPNDPNGRQAIQRIQRAARRRQQPQRRIAGNDRESQAMERYLRNMESGGRAGPSRQGVIPEGALDAPVTLVRSNDIPVTGEFGVDTSGRSRQIPRRG